MTRHPFWQSRRTPQQGRTRRSPGEFSNVNALRSRRLDANLVNGVWLHPTSVTAVSELEQWYDLEFRVPAPPPHEGWPR